MTILMILIILKRSKMTDQERIDQFNQNFSTLFYEFKEDSITSWLFYLFYILRRFIIIICYNFIEDYILQILLTLTISLIVIFI